MSELGFLVRYKWFCFEFCHSLMTVEKMFYFELFDRCTRPLGIGLLFGLALKDKS